MVDEKKVEARTGLEQASRSASRWLWISAALDVLPLVVAMVAALLMVQDGASPAFFGFLFIIGGGVAAILAAAALWKVRAGYRIRQGVEKGDGSLFASAFVPLRRVLVVAFIMFALSTLFALAEGC